MPSLIQRPRPPRASTGPRTSRGQSLVEFALLAPVFIFLFLFAIDFGRLYFTYVQVSNAAREAAAYGATQPTDLNGMQVRAAQEKSTQSQGEQPLDPLEVTCATPATEDSPPVTVDCANAAGAAGAGNTLTVTAVQPFGFLTPLVDNFFGGGLRMSASVTTVIFVSAIGGTGGAPGSCAAPTLATFTVVQSAMDVIVDPGGSKPDAGLCTISGYNWDFGDDSTDVGSSIPVTHTYAANGSYTITLQVTNQGGELSAIRTITVPPAAPTPTPSPTPTATPSGAPTPPPSASPSPTPTASPCPAPVAAFTWATVASKTVQFTDRSTAPLECPITNWLWDFGDGTPVSNAPNPLHEYQSSNTRTVMLTVTSSAGPTSVTHSVNP